MGPQDYLDSILRYGKTPAIEVLGEEKAQRLDELVWQRFRDLEKTAPAFRERVNRGLFVAAIPLVALYKSLQIDFDLNQQSSLDLAERMLRQSYAERMGPMMSVALNAMYQFPPMRRLMMAQMTKATESSGFHFEKVDVPKAIMAFDVHACPIVHFAKQHGVPEVVPIICRLDDLIADKLAGIELKREGTIGMGAERCDFRYVRTK